MEAMRSTWTDSRLDVLNELVLDLDKRVVDLDKRVGRLEVKVEELDRRLARVETKIEQFDERLGRVEATIERLDQRVDSLEGQVRDLSSDVKDGFARMGDQMLAMRTEFGQYQRTVIQFGSALIGTLAIGIFSILITQI